MKRLAALLLLALTACSTSSNGPSRASKDADVKAHARFVAPVPADKVLVIVEENHSYAQLKAGMPYLWSLAKTYGYATNSRGNYHPSQPNYVVMAAGSNRGITTNSYKQVSGPSIMGNAIKGGRTAKVIADGMGTDRCRQTGSSPYAFRHNPWVPFRDERKLCESQDFDYKFFAGDVANAKLANVEFLIPSNNHNGHDQSLKVADDWLKRALAYVFAGPDWQSGRLAIIVTADEDDKQSGQQILTVVIHPSQSGHVVTTRLDHYSLHRTLARFGHTPPLGKAATATDLATAFGLPVN